MPTVINKYLLSVDLYRFHVQPATLRAPGPPPVDLVALTCAAALNTYRAGGFTVFAKRIYDSAYRLRLDVYHGTQLLGFMLTDRIKKDGPRKHLRSFHTASEAFITSDPATLISTFLDAFGLEIANHSQLDIALDTQQVDPAELISNYTEKPDTYHRLKRKGDKGWQTIGTRDEITSKLQYTTYFNMNSKTVSVKIYDKSRELQQKPKAWLSDWYATNGFDCSKPVYRVEISIKAKALRRYRRCAVTEDGEEFSVYRADALGLTTAAKKTYTKTYELMPERFNQPAYLAGLFKEFFPVDIRKKDATRPTNASRVTLIDYDSSGCLQINSIVAIQPTVPTLVSKKRRIKDLVLDYRDTGETHYLDSARGVAERYQLGSYLDTMLTQFVPAVPLTSLLLPPQRMAA